MHSHIIVNQDLEQGLIQALSIAKVRVPSPDLELISPDKQQSIGIDQIRTIISWLAISPLKEPIKYAIFTHAQLLTQEAQHALLKTLEEPPPKAAVILITPNTHNLLATILSRCQIHTYQESQKLDTNQLIEILALPQINRFSMSTKYKDKTLALEFIQNLISQSHYLLQTNPAFAPIATRLLETQSHLESNAHAILALDQLWLDLPVIE